MAVTENLSQYADLFETLDAELADRADDIEAGLSIGEDEEAI